MIAHLKGLLVSKSDDHVVVDVGGVGYKVFVSALGLAGLPQNNQIISLHIYTHVREDQLSLFGFSSAEEKSVFQRLLNVSGVGPKLAMTILSGLSPNDLVKAVIKEDMARLSAISGIGKKTAERLVVDLKDRFVKEFSHLSAQQYADRPLYNDALSALTNLGYQKMVIEKQLTEIDIDKHKTVQSIVKEVLRQIGQR